MQNRENCMLGKNAEQAVSRARSGALAGLVGLLCNVLLFGAKLLVGTLANSIAITADAFNNLSDAGSCAVTAVGFKISGKPADKEHPFGHGRVEYISALVVAFFILLVAVELLGDAIDKIIHPAVVEGNIVTVLVLAGSIAAKLFMGLYYRHVGKKIGSPSLMAAMTDCISDVIATTGVLASLLISMQFHWNIDAAMGAIVSVVIFIAGIKALRETLNPLLGQAPDAQLVNQIRERVLSYDGILGIHDMLVHNYGPDQWTASLHAEVPAHEDIMKSHDLIDQIERDLMRELHIHTVIHMDPIETDNERVSELRAVLGGIVERIDPRLSFHDFRIVDGPHHTNLIFDLLVPHGYSESAEALTQRVENELKKENKRYFAVITVDTSFTGEQ